MNGNLLADPSVIALIRLPVGISTLVTLGHPLGEMAKRKGGPAMMREEGEWLVIWANAHALAEERSDDSQQRVVGAKP